MALFKVVNNQAQLDAGQAASTDVYGAGIRFTQDGAARTTRFAGTAFNQGIPMSPTGQVAIVDATSGLPVDAIYLNGLPISGNKVCVSLNASSVISNGLPFDSNGVLVGSLSGFTTLSLDFTGSTTLDPRITFSRTSNATLTDSNGRVAYAPHNLLTNSEDFEAAAWTKFGTTVSSNNAVATNSTTTADSWIMNAGVNFTVGGPTLFTAGSSAYIASSAITVSAISYTYSAYVKAGVTLTHVQLRAGTGADLTGTSYGALIRLSDGALVSVTAGATALVDDAGNGWFRVSLTFPATAAAWYFGFWAWNSGSIVANGTESINVWGAQLNVANAPVNLLTFSEQFDNAAWARTSINATGTPAWVNVTTAPDGTLTADKLIANLNNTDHVFSQATISITSDSSFTCTQG